ncbi:MAG: hypothetical protein KDG52_06285 [Rhodocyclaceae bacterium]|nr:hypothetical protein [Rhodocyclaceae bacterium]
MERLLSLGRDPATIVAERAGFRVHQHQDLRWLHGGGAAVQSVMSLASPERPLLPAVMPLLTALLWQPQATTALNLGLGGAAIERFVACSRPALRLRSVEASREALVLARQYFGLPDDADVAVSPAEEFVVRDHHRYDLVWCDLFDGERQADCVTAGDFLSALCRRVGEPGVLAMNLCPREEAELVATLAHLRRELPWIALSVRSDSGNVGVLASRRALPDGAALRARQAGEEWSREMAAVADALIRLPAPR